VQQRAPKLRVVQEEAQAPRVAQLKAPELVVYQKDLLEKEKLKQVAEPPGQKTWTQDQDQKKVWRWRRGSSTRQTHVGR
jgi:hypothetical protein